MAAFGALHSLKHVMRRHVYEYPGYLPPPKNSKMKQALEQIDSTLEALEILDNDFRRVMKKRSWELVEAHVQKRFPLEYPIARFAFFNGIDVQFLQILMKNGKVEASDIGRIRPDADRLQNLLQSLLSYLQQQQQQPPLLLADQLDSAKHLILSLIPTVKKITEKDVGSKSRSLFRLRDEFKVVSDLKMVRLRDEFKVVSDLLLEFHACCCKAIKDWKVAVRRLDVSRSKSSRMRVNALEIAIREKAFELEDLLEPPRMSNQFPMPFPMDQPEVIKYIPPFTQCMRMLEEEYIKEVIAPLPEKADGDDDNIVSSIKYYDKNKSKMVGLYNEVDKIKTLFGRLCKRETIALFGMAGIGKTTVAKQIFEDRSILESFELHVWVEIGQNYQLKRIKQNILAQVLVSHPDNIEEILIEGGDEGLDEYLHRSLKGKRYLIVLDDVWENNFWDGMIKRLFPDDENGSKVLVTTRHRTLVTNRHQIRFFSKEESWTLLHEKVFGEEALCPPLLENAGKKIAESCEGLPLTIVTVGKILSKVDQTPEKWNELADNPNSLIEHAYDVMSNVLLPSYIYLSQYLKASFLYMGVFPCNYEISHSELLKLWVSEKLPKFGEDRSINFIIHNLYQNSLIMKRQKRSTFGMKTWCLHSVFWYLCREEGTKHKFSYAIGCLGDSLSGGIKKQRRLCIHKNILFGIKDAHKSMSSISSARSLLCTGPPHLYPVPICFNLKLLRILNAVTIRLYEFPMDVLKLFRLRYLAVTCYGNLPSSISKLWNLEILIVRRHLSMGSSKSPSYLPMKIWDMKELKHLQIMGSDLPTPCEGTILPNLETLLDVSAHSCDKCVFEGTPNLEKLGVRIELRPNGDATKTTRCFDHIHHLKRLVSLKCVVVNPTFGPHITKTLLYSVFPSTLVKLSLSGFGYSWEDMRLISLLPKLYTLKLRCHAFRGTNFEIKDNGFLNLRFLLIEDANLVNWTVEKGSLRRLQKVFLKSCYTLENITRDIKCNQATIVDCFKLKSNPFVVYRDLERTLFKVHKLSNDDLATQRDQGFC